MTMKKVLTIAGSDSSGGAGAQADLKTFQEYQVYGMTALTSIVTMDPVDWKHMVDPIDVNIVEKELNTILSTEIDAMKTGMLGSVEIIELSARKIDEYELDKIVIDPVMVCKGDNEVLQPENTESMRDLLLPRATVVTPNLFEAAQLAKTTPIKTLDEMKNAAMKINEFGAQNVIIKGGRTFDQNKAIDLFFDGANFVVLEEEMVDTPYNHGAGCTFAAAVTAELAKGSSVEQAVKSAKKFVTAAISHGWKLNNHVGPVMHGAYNLVK